MSEEASNSRFSRVLKWVGYLTAILSLLGTLVGIGKFFADRAETNRKIAALLASESVQLQGRDYSSAWETLEQAASVKPDSPEVIAAQDALAEAWLEDIRVQGSEKYSGFAEKLDPVLTRAVASSKPGPANADLLSHLGWSYFLQSREGKAGLDPPGAFARAIAEDQNNPYAHAMWGFWILSNHGDLADAEQHFAQAIGSQRQGDFVRRLQMDALSDCTSDDCDEEIVRVATAMRAERRAVDEDTRSHIFGIYYLEFVTQDARATRFINSVPPSEHVATFRWLFDGADLGDSNNYLRTYYLAVLQEAAGQRDDALANDRLVRGAMPGHDGPAWDAAGAAIKRLSSAH